MGLKSSFNACITRFAQSEVSAANETAGEV
jgi:hypothetical protein